MPSKPTPPERGYSFTDHQESQPTEPLPAPELDIELDRAFTTITDLIEWVGTAVGDDGGWKAIPVDGIGGPQGPKGDTGDPGLFHRGAWDPAVAYAKNDGVFFEGSTWIAKTPNINAMPPAYPDTENPAWFLMSLGNAGAGVGSFNGRSGPVVPQPEDYSNYYMQLTGGGFLGPVILKPFSEVEAQETAGAGGAFTLRGEGVNRDLVLDNFGGTFRIYDPASYAGLNMTVSSSALSYKGNAVWHGGNLAISSYALTLLDDTTASAARATLGLSAMATAAFSTTAQATAGTDLTTVMNPARVKEAIDALAQPVPGFYSRANGYTSSGTFVVPAGVTQVMAIIAGGGGGGGGAGPTSSGNTATGGSGGNGGLTLAWINVTAGASMTVTVGSGGAGSNSANGSAGGSSSFGGISAPGGGGGNAGGTNTNGSNGSNGSPTGGTLNTNTTNWNTIISMAEAGVGTLANFKTIIGLQLRSTSKRDANNTSATAFTASSSGTTVPGVGGKGETAQSDSDASGGVGGYVIILS
jgi:hypothetical protein